MLLPLLAQASQTAMGPGDWRYDSLDRLSQAGLLAGHPKGPLSGWAASLTRYEAAALTLRAVEAMGEAYQAQGKSLVQVAQATGEKIPPPVDEEEAAAQKEQEPAAEIPAGLTSENLAVVQKLIEEFRTELVTMGARVDYLETSMKDAQSRLAAVESERKKHAIDGYTQFRYQSDHAPKGITNGESAFLVRRVRLNVRGPVSDRLSYRVEMQFDSKETGKGPGSKGQLRTLALDYRFRPEMFLRAGQVILPWGYELEESVPLLWTGERALFMDRLFPDQRGVGAFVEYRKSSTAPKLDLGAVNGVGINALDNNSRSSLLARADFPVSRGSVAVSAFSGRDGAGDAQTAQDRYGVSSRLAWGKAQFMGEWVTGKDLGHDVRGWYAQLGHPVRGSDKHPDLLFAKYDTYDENTDASNDLFRRWSLGYWYELDKATRLTAVWELRDVDPAFSEFSKWTGTGGYLQLQVKF
jgi:hypothetical protein